MRSPGNEGIENKNEEVTLDTGWPENHIVNLWKSLTWIKHKKNCQKTNKLSRLERRKKHLHGLCFHKKSDKELKKSQEEVNREKFGDWEDL